MSKLPAGTVNLAINIPEAERRLLGRLAFEEDVSTGAFVRRCLLDGLRARYPDDAARIHEIRRARRAGILLGAFILVVAAGQHDLRRPSGSVRVRRQEIEEVAA